MPDEKSDDKGWRFNSGKIRYDLVPPAFSKALANHFTEGAKKYADRNWEKGFQYEDVARAIQSHLNEWRLGNDLDVEDPRMPGYFAHHLIAAAWNCCVLYELQRREVGVDDRVIAQFIKQKATTNVPATRSRSPRRVRKP